MSDDSATTVHFTCPVSVRFCPTHDITAFELATIFARIGMWVSDNIVKGASPDVMRHFKADNDGNA
jgi:hypothetical protein